MQRRPLIDPPHNFNLQSLAYQALSGIDRQAIQQNPVPCLPDTMKCNTNDLRLGFQIFFNQKLTWKSEDDVRTMGFRTCGNPVGFDVEGPKINCNILDADLQGNSEFLCDFTDSEIPTMYNIVDCLNKLCYEEISFETVEEYKIVYVNKLIHCGPIILDIELSVQDGIDMQQLTQFCHHAHAWQWQNLQAVSNFEDYFSKLLGKQITTTSVQPMLAFNASTTKGLQQLIWYDEALQRHEDQILADRLAQAEQG